MRFLLMVLKFFFIILLIGLNPTLGQLNETETSEEYVNL